MREVERDMSVDVGAMSRQKEMGDGALLQGCACGGASGEMSQQIRRLPVITIAWMLVECALALFSAWRVRSPVLLAFGADSLIELLSALVVLLQFVPRLAVSTARATRLAGMLSLHARCGHLCELCPRAVVAGAARYKLDRHRRAGNLGTELEIWWKSGGNLGTSMIGKSQGETEIPLHLEERVPQAR